MQEAKVSRAAKTFWQYVLQNQPQKFRAGKAAQLALFGSAVLISKANLADVMAEDVLLADYAAIQIAAQIDQCFFARSNRFAVDNPLLGMLRQFKPSGFDGAQDLGAKDFGERFMIE